MSRRPAPAPVKEESVSDILENELSAADADHLLRKAQKVLARDQLETKHRLRMVETVVRMSDDMNHPDLVAALREALGSKWEGL